MLGLPAAGCGAALRRFPGHREADGVLPASSKPPGAGRRAHVALEFGTNGMCELLFPALRKLGLAGAAGCTRRCLLQEGSSQCAAERGWLSTRNRSLPDGPDAAVLAELAEAAENLVRKRARACATQGREGLGVRHDARGLHVGGTVRAHREVHDEACRTTKLSCEWRISPQPRPSRILDADLDRVLTAQTHETDRDLRALHPFCIHGAARASRGSRAAPP